MNCQECELLLAQSEIDAAAQMHLRDCPDCRALADALAANAAVLGALRSEELPRIDVKIPRRRIYGYAAAIAAAAAALLIGMQLPRPHTRPPAAAPVVSQEAPPEPPAAIGASPAPLAASAPAPVRKLQPLKIKMLTPDPDVVIYWIVD